MSENASCLKWDRDEVGNESDEEARSFHCTILTAAWTPFPISRKVFMLVCFQDRLICKRNHYRFVLFSRVPEIEAAAQGAACRHIRHLHHR
jgi:hypothetical protein